MSSRRQNGDAPVSVTEKFDSIRNDYGAAKKTRFSRTITGISTTGSGADYHVRSERDFLFLIEQARYYDRDDPIVGRGITALIDNVLQGGPRLDPKTGNPKADARILELWKEWSESADACDSKREHKLDKISEICLRARLVDGDVFNLPLENGRLQTVEAHRCRTPRGTSRNVVLGILLNDARERLEYWFTKEDISGTRPLRLVSEITPYSARDKKGHRQVFHLYDSKRISQTRGITVTAPIRDFIGMHGDIQFAKLVQQQLTSCYAIFRELPVEWEGSSLSDPTGAISTETLGDGSEREIEGIAPGMTYTGLPGEKLSGFSPNVPNAEYFEHVFMILSIIAVNLGIPVQVLMLDARQTNFSGWRGAMDQARVGFTRVYDDHLDGFYEPVYAWKLRGWLKTDEALQTFAKQRKTKDIAGHTWSRPHWPYIEPSKDAKADETIIKERLNSRRRVLARRGLDIDDIDKEIVEDNARLIVMAIEAAQVINSSTADALVDWRELVGFDVRGRKPDAGARAMENIARAVRAGVPVGVGEAREALGLSGDVPEGKLLRFNDQDVLQYHIENGILLVDEVRKVLGLTELGEANGGHERVRKTGLEVIGPGNREGEGGDGEEEEGDDDDERDGN